jgi:hypothetical protein
VNTSGGRLSGAGVASVQDDTVVLTATDLGNGLVIFIEGTLDNGTGLPSATACAAPAGRCDASGVRWPSTVARATR